MGLRINCSIFKWNLYRMPKNFLSSRLCKLLTISTREFNQFYQKSLSNKRMMKLDSSKKSRTKLNNLVLNFKRFLKKKSRGMSICKIQCSLIRSILLIPNLTVFFKIEKPFLALFHLLKKYLAKRKVERRQRSMDNSAQKTRRLTKRLTNRNNMNETEKILKISTRKSKNFSIRSKIS